MTRTQRRAHLLIWLVLAPIVVGGVVLAVVLRPPPALEPASEIRGEVSR